MFQTGCIDTIELMYYNEQQVNDKGEGEVPMSDMYIKEKILELLELAGKRELNLIYRFLKNLIG